MVPDVRLVDVLNRKPWAVDPLGKPFGGRLDVGVGCSCVLHPFGIGVVRHINGLLNGLNLFGWFVHKEDRKVRP